MDKLGFGISGRPIADISSSSLEIGAGGAGAYLEPFLATGRPDFDIIRLGRTETDTAGT